MRSSLGRGRDTNELLPCSAPQLRSFVARARDGLLHFNFDQNVEIFYWLGKCAQGSGEELDEDLLLAYTSRIRSQALACTETRLARILRTFLDVLNRNKIASSADTDVQRQMEAVAHELLAAALPRLCSRHRHLSLLELGVILSVYAKMFRTGYLSLFEAVAEDAVARIQRRTPWGVVLRSEFTTNGPFILVAYAQARCAHPAVFDAYLHRFEGLLEELTYENVAVLAYAVAHAGIHRPSFWLCIDSQLAAGGTEWSTRAVGRIMAACRKVLVAIPEDGGSDGVILRVVRTAGRTLLTRGEDIRFHEASDLVMALAALPSSAAPRAELTALLRLACGEVQRTPSEFPPAYLAGAFHALVAMLLRQREAGPEGEEDACLALQGLRALSPELRARLQLCAAPDMELLARALWALVGRAPPGLVWEFGVDCFLLVHQREAVRKAREFGPAAVVRFARLTAETAEAACALAEPPPPRLDGRRGLLRPWFLPQILAYCERAGDAEAGLEARPLAWLSTAVAAGQASMPDGDPWPRAAPSTGLAAAGSGSALEFAYSDSPTWE